MTEKVKPNEYKLQSQIAKIVESNCVVIPWEGIEVDKSAIVSEIMELLTQTKEYSVLRHLKPPL